ncbi:MAG: DUF5691 domain-containing protein [Planctomycetales bacterium]
MEELTRQALIGTGQPTALEPWGSHPAEEQLAALPGDERQQFLLRSALHALWQQAGQQTIAGIEPIPPAPPESLRVGSQRFAELLQRVLAAHNHDLLNDFLGEMAARGFVLPPESLPAALDCTASEVRERLLPVLGERGRWLCRQNPDWAWAERGITVMSGFQIQELRRIWEEGTLAARAEALATVRRADPQQAREWLEPVLAQEKPDHRARLLEVLYERLTSADEPFLETRLEDRSLQVVQVAAQLLSLLPDSRLAERMRTRADALLTATGGTTSGSLVLTGTPPEAIGKEWERDGIPRKAPAGRGPRAFWTEMLLSHVPPVYWVERFQAEPVHLLEAVRDDPFASSILTGWTCAAVRFAPHDPQAASWTGPLWRHWAQVALSVEEKGRVEIRERLQGLLRLMPPAEAEGALLDLLRALGPQRATDLLPLLADLPRPWGAPFAAPFHELVRQRLARESDHAGYQWACALPLLARGIPFELMSAALAPWEVAETEKSAAWQVDAVRREIEAFQDLLRLRQSFVDELQ